MYEIIKIYKNIKVENFFQFFKETQLEERILEAFIKHRPESKVYIFGLQNISIAFIERHLPCDFEILSRNPYFIELLKTEDINKEWLNELDWEYIVSMYELTANFLKKYHSRIKCYRYTIRYNIYTKTDIIDEWEKSFNIPDQFYEELY